MLSVNGVSASFKSAWPLWRTSIARVAPELSLPEIEHEYRRLGSCAYLAAWDVHQAKIYGRCESRSTIVTFDRLVQRVMHQDSYRHAHRVFWIVDNGTCHRGPASIQRLQRRYPNLRLIHAPIHASWLNQVEIYEAQRRYIEDRMWQELHAYGARRARKRGITEEDVPRLVEEYRREKRSKKR